MQMVTLHVTICLDFAQVVGSATATMILASRISDRR